MNQKKYVTVFGSSLPRPGDEEYENGYLLGRLLALNNINVCSGGFQGIMDAVSKGASENGAEAVGVTIDLYNAVPSGYLTRRIECHTLFERLKNLVDTGDAYIILQGGTGTLLEMALIWEYMNKGMIIPKPVACHGKLWEGIVGAMEKQIQKEKRQTGLVKCFAGINECATFIIRSLSD
jgi:uncharacterized protein (TIGR00725 family)